MDHVNILGRVTGKQVRTQACTPRFSSESSRSVFTYSSSATCTVTFELFSLTTEASTTASFVYLLRLCLPLGAAWSALPFAHEDKWSSNNNCVMLTACRPLKDLFGFTRESHVQLPWAEHKELTNFLTPIAVTVRPRHYSWTYIKPAVFFS
jgi:hypothetical protein